jgi:hypothetical protein
MISFDMTTVQMDGFHNKKELKKGKKGKKGKKNS